MVFDFLKGQFIDVIAWTDDTRDTMVWRFERQGNEIKYGAKLTVREGQVALFVHEGQLADVFTPGLYELKTNNVPVLTALQHWDHGFQSPFKSEIYFVNTTRFADLKWGTQNPIIARDPEFGPVRLRAFGTYAMKVSAPGKFLTEIVGTDGDFDAGEITAQIRNIIVQELSRVLASAGIPVLDMAANTHDLGDLVLKAISPRLADYGLTLPEFYIENISLPEEVEKVLDKRTSMGIAANLDKFMQFNAAESLNQPNSAAGGTMAAGLGAGMGLAMAQGAAGPWGLTGGGAAGGAGAVPPPPPGAAPVWHLAEGGQTLGPFTLEQLRARQGEGKFARETLVWTAGQEGWKAAGDLPGFAAFFGPPPPPPPPQG